MTEYGTYCFLCHRTFGDDVLKTEEDVVPKWLLKRLDLGNAAADMPNGQVIRYGSRKVPCCSECNGRMSTQLEKPISEAFDGGFDALMELPPTTLFLWLAKIFYGTRFREVGLRQEVRDPDAAPMLEHQDLLGRADYLRRCILTNPGSLRFASQPASVFAFRAGLPAAKYERFDLFVSTFAEVDMIAIRVADTFLICIFGDNGFWVRKFESTPLVKAVQDRPIHLHPLQCTEFCLWFASEAAGYSSDGCFDFVSVSDEEGLTEVGFVPQFRVERNGASEELLSVLYANSFMKRLGIPFGDDDRARVAAGNLRPSVLINHTHDTLVIPECFERTCPELFRLAGWETDLPPCPACS